MPNEPTTQRRPRSGSSAADRVASIVGAAEAAAQELHRDAEARVKERIAEGDRAAKNRIVAAEEEATEILAEARAEAERIVRDGRDRDEQAKTTATSEALTIIAKAQENAEQMLTEATESASRHRAEAERYTRGLITEARGAATEVRTEGLELAANLRQMGDSLRSNAERILRDVQGVHSQMVTRLDRVEPGAGEPAPESRRPRDAGSRTARERTEPDDLPDVPEFIPRR